VPHQPGSRIGPYEIVSAIGAGGMGEVYRARDTRLDRTVAIKVLTGALSGDPESRTRFEQEARAIAALNDPHICTLYDISLGGDLDYLVLEYLEGETLADELRRSPVVPVAEALAIAIQIGDALDRAHRAGIAHRDLKPGNVMLVRRAASTAPPGKNVKTVKLLDFGLAARTSVARPALDATIAATMAPTLAAARPQTASAATSGLVGTIQYMAPERLDGQDGDHRADIFAFGCVLYEMIAGRKAFEGANVLTAVATIKNSEPPPVSALQAEPLLDHAIRRCLAKDPEERWQSIRDVTSALRWIAEHRLSPSAAGSPSARSSVVWRMATGFTVVVAIGAITAAVLALRGRGTPVDLQSIRFEVATAPTDDPSVSLSADGKSLAFVANQNGIPMLWIRSLDSVDNRVLAGTEGAGFPFWSPDGRAIGFFAGNKLKRIDVAGGAPIVIADAPNARGGDWNADGVILFAPGVQAPIMRVPAGGGPVEQVTRPDEQSGPAHRVPQFLPDGKRFLFSSTLGGPATNGVYLSSLDKTPPVRLLLGDTGGRFMPPDKLLAIRQGALQIYDFDARSGAVSGQPTMIAQGFRAGIATASFASSNTGLLAYRAGTAQRRQLVWVDRKGVVLHAVGDPESDYISSPELSADEQSVLVFTQRSGNNDAWVIELARNLPRRITDGPGAHATPLWDPDGDHIVYSSPSGLTRQAVNGGKQEPLIAGGIRGNALAWTRDRQYFLLRRDNNGTGDLVAVSMKGEPREMTVAQSPSDETEGQFSLDGKWIAFVSNDSGRAEVFVQSFPEGRMRTQVSTTGGTQVRWSSDAKEIYYVAPDGKMMSVSIALDSAQPVVKLPAPLFQTHLATGTNILGYRPQYAVSRDGRFLLNTAIESASAPIVVVANWMKSQPK
jgi:serine/threonine protein kinase/Tol biopolymer transport system component